MSLPGADADRFALVREHLYTPVVGDVLDQLGRTHQFLPPAIQPLQRSMVLVGRAMPVLIADVFGPQRSRSAGSPRRSTSSDPGRSTWRAVGGRSAPRGGRS
jgi:hypothetical protein